MNKPILFITDCADPNAVARQSARAVSLTGYLPTIVALPTEKADHTASLILLDTLLATETLGQSARPFVVILNTAPRDGRYPNGVPFCFFWLDSVLVVAPFNGRVLSLVRRHLGIKQVYITDAAEVVATAAKSWADISSSEVEALSDTQFRSLWYAPLLASWVSDGFPLPCRLDDVPTEDETEYPVVAVIDNFGNCKLNRPADEIGFRSGRVLRIRTSHGDGWTDMRPVRCYQRLVEVPRGELGLTVGSSGVNFAELVVRNGSAADRLGLEAGSLVAINPA